VTEISDKITACIELLVEDKILENNLSFREIYNKYLHPEKIDTTDEKIWNALGEGNIMDVFQFSSKVGLATARQIKPKDPIQMTSANALTLALTQLYY